MINLFSDPEKDRLRKASVDRIRRIIIQSLGEKSELYQIKVMELDHCPDPSCEKIETLIILLGNESQKIQYRFPCPLAELTEEKMAEFLIAIQDL